MYPLQTSKINIVVPVYNVRLFPGTLVNKEEQSPLSAIFATPSRINQEATAVAGSVRPAKDAQHVVPP
jgi:hypothetical protein